MSGLSPVFTTTPCRTHCQNCVCVVQNCFRVWQITSAVFFFFFAFFVLITNRLLVRLLLERASASPGSQLIRLGKSVGPSLTPKGSLSREAASVMLEEARCLAAHENLSLAISLSQKPRHQLGPTLHAELDEDVAQVKLHRLFADKQSLSDLGVTKPLRAAQSHLGLAAA